MDLLGRVVNVVLTAQINSNAPLFSMMSLGNPAAIEAAARETFTAVAIQATSFASSRREFTSKTSIELESKVHRRWTELRHLSFAQLSCHRWNNIRPNGDRQQRIRGLFRRGK